METDRSNGETFVKNVFDMMTGSESNISISCLNNSITTGLISKDTEVKRWPCVHQIYLAVQPHDLGMLTGSDIKKTSNHWCI
jgi:hypothetical protein